jgi:cytochrome P450
VQTSAKIGRADTLSPVRPAAPFPSRTRPSLLAMIRALRTNPITVFPKEAYEVPILEVGVRRNLLLVSDPDAINRVLVDNAANYRKSVQQQRRLQPALGNELLTAEGETWRRARRISAPLFAPKAIAALFDDIQSATQTMLGRWRDRPSFEQPIDLSAEFQRLTYEIVSRTVFSGALDQDRARIHANMAIYFETLGRIDLASIFNLPPWFPSFAARRARPALGVFRTVVERVVTQRLDDSDRDDVDLLDRLIHASDPETGEAMPAVGVSDNVLTFLAAGHETTGNALAWLLYLLALSPATEKAVLDELHAALAGGPIKREHLDQLVVMRAVVNEALRLYPPAPFIGREALAGDKLGGHHVRAGTQILISPWIVHRHRALWPDPDAFVPERFLTARSDTIPRGAFIPFGLGPRICIGQGFAVQEILTVLAAILPAFQFSLPQPQAVFPQARITLRPAAGLPMVMRPR